MCLTGLVFFTSRPPPPPPPSVKKIRPPTATLQSRHTANRSFRRALCEGSDLRRCHGFGVCLRKEGLSKSEGNFSPSLRGKNATPTTACAMYSATIRVLDHRVQVTIENFVIDL
ncbi:hypothetical protein NL676_013677 [Syzygium grande]|nr:hypothetical protein NL676_013677 [Syzygium grande]